MADYSYIDNSDDTSSSSTFDKFGKYATAGKIGGAVVGGAALGAATNAFTTYIQQFFDYLYNSGYDSRFIGDPATLRETWAIYYDSSPTLMSMGIGILGVFAAWLLYKAGKKVYDIFKNWLASRNIDDSQIDEEKGEQIVQESDDGSSKLSGWKKAGAIAAGTGATLGAGAAGLGAAAGKLQTGLFGGKWYGYRTEGGTLQNNIIQRFLNNHEELREYLEPIMRNPGKTALVTVGTVLAGYGLYKALKQWKEHLKQAKEENPNLEIPANV